MVDSLASIKSVEAKESTFLGHVIGLGDAFVKPNAARSGWRFIEPVMDWNDDSRAALPHQAATPKTGVPSTNDQCELPVTGRVATSGTIAVGEATDMPWWTMRVIQPRSGGT